MASAWAVQLSDLHIGEKLGGGGFLPKVMGHDQRALEALAVFLRGFHKMHANDERMLVVSGDVTAKGSADELAFYRTLVQHGVAINNFSSVGPLNARFHSTLEIPGNHDYWSGVLLPNPVLNKNLRAHHFSRERWSYVSTPRRVIAFHGLCSTSGASPDEQVLAVGSFMKEDRDTFDVPIRDAEEYAQSIKKDITHFIVMHHSPADGTPLLRGISRAARSELETLCARFKIRGILTGHAHTRWLDDAASKHQSLPLEARCATTLQKWWLVGRPARELLVHEFYDSDSGSLGWRVTPWRFNGTSFHTLASTSMI